mmetsp:Transcript_7655/g.22448  ORF Transcript_7655/g.22448 Transcript_7655/m.22448 type:complete len:93 (+) Transcript_7655:2357-2635(+)
MSKADLSQRHNLLHSATLSHAITEMKGGSKSLLQIVKGSANWRLQIHWLGWHELSKHILVASLEMCQEPSRKIMPAAISQKYGRVLHIMKEV